MQIPFFTKFFKEEVPVMKAALGNIIAPYFIEIPPQSKAGAYLREGLRSWAYVAISSIADEIAQSGYKLYRKKGTTKGEWQLITENHPFKQFFDKPNSFQTKEEMLWLIVTYLLAEGEAPIVLDKEKNPTSMALLTPSNLEVVYSDKDFISGYKYRQTNGQMKVLKPGEVIFYRLPSTESPFRGCGVLKYIASTIDIDAFMEEWLRVFFYNYAAPGGTLETDAELDDASIKRLRSQFEARHRGVKNAHKMNVLEKGLKFNKTSFSMNDLQLGEQEKQIRDKVLSAFKVPKSVAGITEDVNRANGENADRVFARRAVKPKLKFIEAQINQYLLPKFGADLWFEFDNPVQEDELLKAQIRQINIVSGVRTVNEYREEDGLEPVEEKQEPIIPDESGKAVPSLVTLVKEMMKPKVVDRDDIKKLHKEKLLITDEVEKRYKERLMMYFVGLKKDLTEQLQGKKVKTKISLNIDVETQEELLASISLPYIEEAIAKQGKLTFAMLGLDGSLSSQDDVVRSFVNKNTVKLGKQATETTSKDVDTILGKWADEELPIADLRSALEEYFDSPARSEVIARTEVARATGFAEQQVYKEVEAVGKEWITAPDEMVCETCADLDGQKVGLNEKFVTLSGDSITYMPAHPNCRCDILPIFGKSELSQIESQRKLIDREVALNNARKRLETEMEKFETEKKKTLKMLDKRLKSIEDILE